jgi:hypothetical protein
MGVTVVIGIVVSPMVSLPITVTAMLVPIVISLAKLMRALDIVIIVMVGVSIKAAHVLTDP